MEDPLSPTISQQHQPKSFGGEMFTLSYMFVRIFSRLNDGEHTVLVTIDPSGDRMLMQAVSKTTCDVYEGTFTEAEVHLLKETCHGGMSWYAFFDILQKSFAERTLEFNAEKCNLKVTMKHERQTEAIPLAPFTSTITVNLTLVSKPDAISDMCEGMCTYLSLRTGDKSALQRLEDVVNSEERVGLEAKSIIHELETLQVEERILDRKNKEIARVSQPLWEAVEATPGISAAEATQLLSDDETLELMHCRVPDPIRKAGGGEDGVFHRSYSTDLLSLAKSCDSYVAEACNVRAKKLQARHSNVVPSLFDKSEQTIVRARLISNDPNASDVLEFIAHLDDWDLDVVKLDAACRKLKCDAVSACGTHGALFLLGYIVIFRSGAAMRYNLSERAVINWLSAVECGYNNVPFHNSIHAASVLHSVYWLLYPGEAVKKLKIGPTREFALILGACVVNLGHEGLTNSYYIKTKSGIATTFANSSPQESFHVAVAFELMRLPRYDLLEGSNLAERNALEEAMCTAVLSTDLASHADLMDMFPAKLSEECPIAGVQNQPETTCTADENYLPAMLLKMADMSCFVKRDAEQYRYWRQRLCEEYIGQGKLEASKGIPVSPFMGDAAKGFVQVAKMQLIIFNFVLIPMYAAAADALPMLRFTGEILAKHRNSWAGAEMKEGLGEGRL